MSLLLPAYTVTANNSMLGPNVTITVQRSGSNAVIEETSPTNKNAVTRTFFNLKTNQSLSWNPAELSAGCSPGRFSGSWGDPFAESADLTAQLSKDNVKQAGTEVVHGFSTKVFETPVPDGAGFMKAWVDAKYGLIVKLQMFPTTGEPRTLTEVTEMSLTSPPDSVFTLPAACAAAAAAPPIPTEAEHIATITGGNAQDFKSSSYGPGSDNTCTVLFRVVRAGIMEPITSRFQVAVDPNVDVDHPVHYTTGLSDTVGQSTFEGGGIHDVTAQVRNGVLRIENVSKQFHMEIVFGKPGSSSGMLYRQCSAPETVLLLVLKNPDKISEGADWLWVKSGKYATITPAR